MAQIDPLISLRDVAMRYESGDFALRGISLNVDPGEFLVVVGASGAGKSSFLKILFGEQSISGGTGSICGRALNGISSTDRQELRRNLGIVFQDFRLIYSKSVWENASLPLLVSGADRELRRKAAAEVLELVGLQGREDILPATLSGGEQQRVAIARALVNRPQVILADEPTGNLDNKMAKIILELLFQANRAGSTVILATHNLALLEPFKLRTIVFDRGRLIGDFASGGQAING